MSFLNFSLISGAGQTGRPASIKFPAPKRLESGAGVALAFLASFSGAGNQKEAPEKPQDGAGADQISAQDLTKEEFVLKAKLYKGKSILVPPSKSSN